MRLGFAERQCGSHRIISRDGADEILNLQPRSDGAEVVIQQWIETAREPGREIPAPRGRLLYA